MDISNTPPATAGHRAQAEDAVHGGGHGLLAVVRGIWLMRWIVMMVGFVLSKKGCRCKDAS